VFAQIRELRLVRDCGFSVEEARVEVRWLVRTVTRWLAPLRGGAGPGVLENKHSTHTHTVTAGCRGCLLPRRPWQGSSPHSCQA